MDRDIRRYQDNLRDELDGAALYAALAAAEPDPLRKDLFLQLAQAESSHAQLWRDKLLAAGVQDEGFVPGLRTHLLSARMTDWCPIFAWSWESPGPEAGMPREDAQRVAAQMMKNKKGALDTLAREELGIDPAELGGNPWSAAATSFALFSGGAIFPVMPFFWMQGHWAIAASALASGTVLCGVGMLSSLFNGRSPWYSAARQLIFGCLAAALTYGIGAALGTTLA
jgi:hypothetical protein